MRCTVHTPDGVLLAVEDRGDPSGTPVLVHHGTPGSRGAAFYGPWVRDAAARGLRLISYDRPGYGDSSPRSGATFADAAADARAICAELGIDRVATWGFSGGAPPALACAALLPDLVTSAAALAGAAPFDAEDLDWFAGMHPDEAEDIQLHLADETASQQKMAEERQEYLLTPSGGPVGDPPQDAAHGGYHTFMLSCVKAGLAPGAHGWWEDNSMLIRPWNIDLADIAVPILLMYGRRDVFVPPSHGEWLVKRIPGAEVRWFDKDGHGTLAAHRIPEAHAWLSAQR